MGYQKIRQKLFCQKISENDNKFSTLFVDQELKLLYMTTKEDSNIHLYDYSEGIIKEKKTKF